MLWYSIIKKLIYFFGGDEWKRTRVEYRACLLPDPDNIKWWWRGISEVRAAEPATPQLDGAGARQEGNWVFLLVTSAAAVHDFIKIFPVRR